MNEVSADIARWLEQKRRADRASAAVISLLALAGGAAVFLLTAFLIYIVLSAVCGAFMHPIPWLALAALGLAAGFFARTIKGRQHELDLGLDPMGFWILKDIASVGPRLMLEGLRQVRCWERLGELNVAACARALAYLAGQNAAVGWEDLMQHCPQVPWARIKEDLSLLEGVLLLAERWTRALNAAYATLNPRRQRETRLSSTRQR